jgi:hypothetical protein
VRRPRARLLALVLATVAGCLAVPAEAASTFILIVQDGPNEGFNDTTPVQPQGGNPATTLGEARLKALELGASLWANSLDSEVTIRVLAHFDPLGGTQTAATLGQGGPQSAFRDFVAAPGAGVWYPAALADRLAGVDLDQAEVDIELTFNSDVDGAVLGSSRFYYGFDSTPPAGDVDFLSVVAHEMGHGLGFVTFLDRQTGAKFLSFDDAYMLHLEHHGASPPDFPSMTDAQRLAAFTAEPDLHWTGPSAVAASGVLTAGVGAGGHLEIYGPNPLAAGSSLTHFSTTLDPDQFMEPFYVGVALDFDLALAVLQDLGWGTAPMCMEVTVP